MPSFVKCSGCNLQAQLPAKPANNRTKTDRTYKYMREQGWEFTSRFLWVCPDCLAASTSPATSVLPGRLHEKDWQPKP